MTANPDQLWNSIQEYLRCPSWKPNPFDQHLLELIHSARFQSDQVFAQKLESVGCTHWMKQEISNEEIAAWIIVELRDDADNQSISLKNRGNQTIQIRAELSENPRCGVFLSGVDDTGSKSDGLQLIELLSQLKFVHFPTDRFAGSNCLIDTFDLSFQKVFGVMQSAQSPVELHQPDASVLIYIGHGLSPQWVDHINPPSLGDLKECYPFIHEELFQNLIEKVPCPVYRGGDWSLKDGRCYFSLEHILELFKLRLPSDSRNKHLVIISDCCYSGRWVEAFQSPGNFQELKQWCLATKNHITIQSSCGRKELAAGSCYSERFCLLQDIDEGELPTHVSSASSDPSENQLPLFFSTSPELMNSSSPIIEILLQNSKIRLFKDPFAFQEIPSSTLSKFIRSGLPDPKTLQSLPHLSGGSTINPGINVMNVGNGDSTIILGQKKLILIDGGKPNMFKDIVWPKLGSLLQSFPPHLDQFLIIITHHDDDHIGGILRLLSEFVKHRDLYAAVLSKTHIYFNNADKSLDLVRNFDHESKVLQQIISLGLTKSLTSAGCNTKISDPLFKMTCIWPDFSEKDVQASSQKYNDEAASSSRTSTYSLLNPHITGANSLSQVWALASDRLNPNSQPAICLFTGDASPLNFMSSFSKYIKKMPGSHLFYSDIPHHGSSHNFYEPFYLEFPFEKYVLSTKGHIHHKFPSKTVLNQLFDLPQTKQIYILGDNWERSSTDPDDHWISTDAYPAKDFGLIIKNQPVAFSFNGFESSLPSSSS